MKKYQLKTPTINKTKQKKKDEILYKYFITAIVIFSLYHLFIESHYLGSDCKYDLYVFWIPTLLGFFIALKFNLFQIDWKCCISDLKKEKNFFYKFFTIPFLILAHFVFALIMFWMPSNIIWDAINKIESNNNQIETYVLKVNEFHRSSGKGSANRIRFVFNEKNESIKTSFKDIEPFLEKNPDNFQIIIEVKKGIWNYYILESWKIKEVLNH